MKRIVKILESRFQEDLPNFIKGLRGDKEEFFSAETPTKIDRERFLQKYLSAYPKDMSGVILIKFWFSITKEKQEQRFEARKRSPLKYWKFSENDAKVIDKYEIMTFYKNQMFNRTSTQNAPWVIINSNDKKVGILNAMRYVLSQVEYPNKNPKAIKWYTEVVNVLKLN